MSKTLYLEKFGQILCHLEPFGSSWTSLHAMGPFLSLEIVLFFLSQEVSWFFVLRVCVTFLSQEVAWFFLSREVAWVFLSREVAWLFVLRGCMRYSVWKYSWNFYMCRDLLFGVCMYHLTKMYKNVRQNRPTHVDLSSTDCTATALSLSRRYAVNR